MITQQDLMSEIANGYDDRLKGVQNPNQKPGQAANHGQQGAYCSACGKPMQGPAGEQLQTTEGVDGMSDTGTEMA